MQWLMELYGVMQMQSDAVSLILFHEIQELVGYVFVAAIQSTCVGPAPSAFCTSFLTAEQTHRRLLAGYLLHSVWR